MRVFTFQRHAVVAVLVLATQASAAPEDAVRLFIDTCIGSLPAFEDVGGMLEGTDFRRSSERQWIRDSDGAVFMVLDAGDRLVCMAGLIGDHTEQFTDSLEASLAGGKLGRVETKQFQGRTLFLLQASKGLTVLEVIPPSGATTFLTANAQKASP